MAAKIEKISGVAFLPFIDMKELLLSELQRRFNYDCSNAIYYGDLVYLPDYNIETGIPYFARCAMLEPFIIHFDSIGDAAGELKKIQRSWAPYSFTCFRRAALIQEKLPYVNLNPKTFPAKIPAGATGLYTLIDDHAMIASAATNTTVPAGRIEFIEDHENPPSRAYLKIQESLSLAAHYFNVQLPGKGSRCFEAGACPGGWTWVLVNQGAEVFAVDRAELAPALMKNKLVTFLAHDAFTLKPEELGSFDWVISDVICYPERLLEWIKMWLASGKTKNMICTIKMQGEINWPLIKEFADIPNSRVVHLNYNKHELTFIHSSCCPDGMALSGKHNS
ncbi:MAG: SAM-dependent methyltransferase [Treponema sp.]|nr:SAM-dependent methyltransferase [Treponema sp.]